MKFAYIRDHRAAYDVGVMCAVFGVTAAGFYAFLKRPESARAARSRDLAAQIGAVHQEVKGVFCQFQRAVEIAYDYRNQMVEYKDLDNLRTHRYHYDCFGRRVAKVADVQNGGGVVTRFVYGGQASWQVPVE